MDKQALINAVNDLLVISQKAAVPLEVHQALLKHAELLREAIGKAEFKDASAG